jgi:hypothetical protein
LFAALEVATGKIIAAHSKRRRRVEFLDFMNSVTAAFPGRKLHVILATTKPSPSSGPRKRSVNAVSKAAVSLSSDSGY